MRRFIAQMSPQRRQNIVDEARTAGRMGADRLPPIVHSDDVSDSLILQALDAHALGLAEHAAESVCPTVQPC